MRILSATILVLSTVSAVNADVSTVPFDNITQQERSGERFKVSVVEKYGNTTITVNIAKRDGERFVGANLHIYDKRIYRITDHQQVGRIPLAATAGKDDGDQQVSLHLFRELATKCRLGIYVDSTSQNAKQAKTYFLIDIGSYFPDQ
jgi:hypothetical protein